MGSLIDLTLNNRPMVLDTSKNVKPDKPKGYLVKTPLYMAPKVYFQDLAKDTYGIVKGVKGKANDHELGKQNDVAMKVGALAIAGYLMSFRQTKLPKLMEVVGVGSFLSSLALWPKLAIALPLKLRTGVDIQQKYVDSYGRKKNFFQDSQYLAWDLYSKDEIKKMGDKMGVPYDVPNRDEVIKEKARKLSVQGNTLWMATAGFATPIMTALICSGLKPAVETLKQKSDLKKTEKMMNSVTGFDSQMAAPKSVRKKLENYLASNKGKKLENFDELISLFDWSPRKSNIQKSLMADLDNLLSGASNDITPEYVGKLYDRFCEPLAKVGVSKEDIAKYFEKNNLYGNQAQFVDRLKLVNKESQAGVLEEATKDILYSIIDSKHSSNAEDMKLLIDYDGISDVVRSYNRRVLDDSIIGKIRNAHESLSNYFAREQVLEKWERARFTDSADSLRTYSSQRITKTILSALGFSSKEIDTLALEGSQTRVLLEQKLDEIAKDPEKYKKVVKKLAEKYAEYESVMSQDTRVRYGNWVDSMCDSAKTGLKRSGFDNIAEFIGGRSEIVDAATGKVKNSREALTGTMRYVKKAGYDFKDLGAKADFYRIIQTLDFYRRLHDNSFSKYFDIIVDGIEMRPPAYEDVVTAARDALLSGKAGNHATKLGLDYKPNTYKTVMRLLYGALPEDFVKDGMLGTTTTNISSETRAIRDILIPIRNNGNVQELYNASIKAGLDPVKLGRYLTGMSDETVLALREAGGQKGVDLITGMKTYMQTFIDQVVNFCDKSYVKRGFDLIDKHNLTGAVQGLPESIKAQALRDSLVGSPVVGMIRRGAKELSNTNKWLRMFGIGGAVLLTGTVLATLFFGHLPQKEMYMKNGNK